MNDRLVTALGLIAALYVAWALMAPAPAAEQVSQPTTEDTGVDGYAALHRWLTASGIRNRSWRLAWSELAGDVSLTGSGNLLFTVVAHARAPRPEAVDALRDWVEAGNTLVIASTLNDTPAWSLSRPDDLTAVVSRLAGIEVEAVLDDEGEPVVLDGEDDGLRMAITPVTEHPLMAGITRLWHVTVAATQIWKPATGEPAQPLMKAAVDARTGAAVIWETRHGAGSIIVIGSGTLLANRMLGEGDNARLVANLIGHRLGDGGTWLFDDRHQGLADDYDPGLLFSDARFWYSVLFLVAGWFIYMLGGTDRLIRIRERTPPPSQIGYVRAVGGLMARKLRPIDAADQLLDQWARELGIGDDPEHRQLWTRLAQSPTLAPPLRDRLQQAHARIRAGRDKSLTRFFNTLHQARKSTG